MDSMLFWVSKKHKRNITKWKYSQQHGVAVMADARNLGPELVLKGDSTFEMNNLFRCKDSYISGLI